ncbi:MAG: aminoacylase [Sphingomonas sp. SCN 67-18]|uniref:N-acyl-D-amino-acid deacylase family protein n=1 Tax=uncultured Sphingomonas sp. TaxID=158754 RepID=UPI00086B5CA4|nr:D-aminoacylase [Sphingomonas sp. SCN 67-18]ODU21609.1 MAG: aminoacylase [Sphingomonas sp. SCN 67-18]
MARRRGRLAPALAALLLAGCATAPSYDLLIRHGTVHDGSGGAPFVGDVAVAGDRIAYVGPHAPGTARKVIDATGKAVAPGFINILSWATESLLIDGRGLSDLRQGVTLEVMGEGSSMGPLTPAMAKALAAQQEEGLGYPVRWTTLGGYLDHVAAGGIAPNIASFIGAATAREMVLGDAAIDPDPAQIEAMRGVVRRAMDEGAMGVASALIYPPGTFAKTPELVALAGAAAECGGVYATHLRSEGDRFLESVDEAIGIGRAADVPVHYYHLKVGGRDNWPKMATAIARIEAARQSGLRVSADVYPYIASGTGLDASMPPWLFDGGMEAGIARLQDPATRRRAIADMQGKGDWENVLRMAGPDKATIAGVRTAALQPLIGRTLADIARERGVSPEEAAIDLVVADRGRVDTIYETMSEDNLRAALGWPFTGIASDAPAIAAEGAFLNSRVHPRTYGSFARILGHYARDEKSFPLAEAVRRMSGLPAAILGLADRGLLRAGHHADIVLFGPATIADHADFTDPHRYATGVTDVFVNGIAALADGKPTGAASGRVVRGRGWHACPAR